ELHVVLPFATDEFVDVSVRRGGDDAVARFERCLAEATSVRFSTDGQYLDAPELFGYASQVAMGNAIMRARALAADAEQLAVWDGDTSRAGKITGTARDVHTWTTTGHASHVVACPSAVEAGTAVASERARRVYAVLFGDVQGFSRLGDAEIPAF